jgi:ribosomal protein L37E
MSIADNWHDNYQRRLKEENEFKCPNPNCEMTLYVSDIKEIFFCGEGPDEYEGTMTYNCPYCDVDLLVPYRKIYDVDISKGRIRLPQSSVCTVCHCKPTMWEPDSDMPRPNRCRACSDRFYAELEKRCKAKGVPHEAKMPGYHHTKEWHEELRDLTKEEEGWGPCEPEEVAA